MYGTKKKKVFTKIPFKETPVFAASICSSKAFDPKIPDISSSLGGGMGYLPMAISTNERPILQMSDCTLYWAPCKRSGWKKWVSF